MARKSIFDLLSEQYNLAQEAKRLDILFLHKKTLIEDQHLVDETYTLKDFIHYFCFDDWKNRGHCLNLQDFLSCVEYTKHYDQVMLCNDFESFLVLVEIIFNCWKMAEIYMKQNEEISCYKSFYHLYDLMVEILSQYNHKAVYSAEDEQVLIIEDRPEVTAVAETIEPELALAVVRYNHHSMQGNVAQKKAILLAMGSELEPNRKTLLEINSNLENGIFFMLNNLNLRHNNCNNTDKNYKEFVAQMDSSVLESWYDELYQMMLLAFLELDQRERNKRVKVLKDDIVGGTH